MELPGPSFNVGLKIQERIRKELCLPVSNPALGRDSFFLVAAFGRCKFQLSCDSVGVLLQATIGGLATDFRVLQLSDRVFRFVVAAKSVGFFITNLLCFECKLFKVFFHLWGNGGPNWRREYSLFLKEEKSSWELAHSSSKSRKSYAEAVINPPLTGANVVPIGRRSVHARIRQPESRRSRPWLPELERINNIQDHRDSFSISDLNLISCSRCLSRHHLRSRCDRPIRCRACMGWGHIAASCVESIDYPRGHNLHNLQHKDFAQKKDSWPNGVKTATNGVGWHSKGKQDAVDTLGWFRALDGPISGSSQHPKSFLDLVKVWIPRWAPRELPPAITVPWVLPSQSGEAAREVETSIDPNPEHWQLNLNSSFSHPVHVCSSSSTAPLLSSQAQQDHQATGSPPPTSGTPSSSTMAFQRFDPRPFVPENLQWVEVENRIPVARAVVSSRPPLQNEDLAIVNIDNLPGNAIQFAAVDEVLREFFHVRRIHVTEIQPSTLGQALVRFAHRIDRDNLVSLGLIPYLDVHLTFTEHNKGRNWRKAYFNTEVWLMLMEFPTDY